MDYTEKWEIDGEFLGKGGQGTVYRVIPRSMGQAARRAVATTIMHLEPKLYNVEETIQRLGDELFKHLHLALAKEDPANLKALKVLHLPEDAKNAEDAPERLKREIEAMQSISHKNLLNIVESDPEHQWYVMDYYQKGDLFKFAGAYAGDLHRSLVTIRPLVEGVAELHSRGGVHRDIKPKNVFVRNEDDLVLGDFGLFIVLDDGKTRLTGEFENVGSRHWMPPWAEGRHIEEISFNFDVYSLGKLLWWMVSGSAATLQREYFELPQFNVEQLHPDAEYMDLANELFRKCIVENEEDCLPDASELLQEVDRLLASIASRVEGTTCSFCGRGVYEPSSMPSKETSGLRPFSCTNCGNVQLFSSVSKATDKQHKEGSYSPLTFQPNFEPNEIALGEKARVKFRFMHKIDRAIHVTAYQFEGYKKQGFFPKRPTQKLKDPRVWLRKSTKKLF